MRRTSYLVVLFAIASGHSISRADRLIESREVTRGDYLAPRFSPDGRELLVTGPQLRGLIIVSATASRTAARAITDDAEAGVHATWSSDGSIRYRAARAGGRRDLAVTRAGAVRTYTQPAPVAFAKDDRMYVVDRKNAVVRIGSGDRFFGAVVAPDGDQVVFQGLTTGLHLYVRSTGTLRHIGPGTAPAWSPDSKRIAFEVTEDDGHDIIASELYIYEVARDRVEPVTATDAVIERRPSFSPTGERIAFDDNTGGIFVGRLEVR
ncbi:MAG: PD40 domain-containing protein [Deltaproteobacteria bacterium]|nr:PD40 domain-containing protein [Deltaproteobacteria bacterium]